jgi:two-component system response regulator FixJ
MFDVAGDSSEMQETMVAVVDNEKSVRASLRMLLETEGYKVREYNSAAALLADPPPAGSCLVVDVIMPAMTGLALQEELNRRGMNFSLILMTGHGNVPLAVQAMKAGAVDFLEKPVDPDRLLGSIASALKLGRSQSLYRAEMERIGALVANLTAREREILQHLALGQSNKRIALKLGISARTVENHRARIRLKLKSKTLAQLIRIATVASLI